MRKGFSLIEVLIAILILSIVMVGVLQGSIIVIRHNMYLKSKEIATEIAQTKINDIISQNTDSLQNGSFSENVTNSAIQYTVSWNISSTASPAGKDISVTVSWQCLGKSYSITLNTWKGL